MRDMQVNQRTGNKKEREKELKKQTPANTTV